MTDTPAAPSSPAPSDDPGRPALPARLRALRQQLLKAFPEQDALVDGALATLLAGGHLLLEGAPGTGKTTLARALAASLDGNLGRLQCRPDQSLAELVGTLLMEADGPRLRRGPLFSPLLLLENLPLAAASIQNVLLDALPERQVILEGRSLPLPATLMVIATRIGSAPDLAPLLRDRFLTQLRLELPSAAQEAEALRRTLDRGQADPLAGLALRPLLNAHDVLALQQRTAALPVPEPLQDYGLRLIHLSRDWPAFEQGAGPRATQALLKLAQGHALLREAASVAVEDLRQALPGVLRARVRLTAEREFEGDTLDGQVLRLLAQCVAPRS